jgi:Sulfotransferase family
MQRSRKQAKNRSIHVWVGLLVLFCLLIRSSRHGVTIEGRRSLSNERPEGDKRSVIKNAQLPKQKYQKYQTIAYRKPGPQYDIVKAYDYIYERQEGNWDSSPIVVEAYKLIFFTIPQAGCTVWKQLLRRMMNLPDWNKQGTEKMLPHNPKTNGLKYLHDYSLEQASIMMTSPEWTRATMVREPKLRFLSTFLDKAIGNDQKHIHERCCPDRICIDDSQTIPGFLDLCYGCQDEHWQSQHERIDEKFWPYIDHVLKFENAAEDSKKLLTELDSWNEFGKKGWGKNGSSSIFQSVEKYGAGDRAGFEEWQVWLWYTPESERKVEEFYHADYSNPLFNFTSGKCLTCLKRDVKNETATSTSKTVS